MCFKWPTKSTKFEKLFYARLPSPAILPFLTNLKPNLKFIVDTKSCVKQEHLYPLITSDSDNIDTQSNIWLYVIKH